MGKSRSFHLGAWSLAFGAAVVLTPVTAAALGPLQPTAAGWVNIDVDNKLLRGDSTDRNAPVSQGWTNVSSIALMAESVNGGPPRVWTLKIERTVTLGEQGFKIPMNKKLTFMDVLLRKAASGGSAHWLGVTLKDPTVKSDTVRSSTGASTGTEILEVTFSSLEGRQSTQTSQDTALLYIALPAWYDLL
ncbi:MAG: hypothetical protein WBR29_12255, partial [Gammaproteobacteria bacterium]